MIKNRLQETFGNIDIYLFDQLIKGRFDKCKKVIDVGCGYGRNLVYFLRNGFDVYGIDQSVEAIEEVKRISKDVSPSNPPENFRVTLVEELPFENEFFDLAISSAVFHFARDENHFNKMLRSTWRVLKPGGFLFARLASDIGIESRVIPLGDKRFRLPDGSDRFLVNEEILLNYTAALQGYLFEPLKTTNVQNQRCMTTWCIQKL